MNYRETRKFFKQSKWFLPLCCVLFWKTSAFGQANTQIVPTLSIKEGAKSESSSDSASRPNAKEEDGAKKSERAVSLDRPVYEKFYRSPRTIFMSGIPYNKKIKKSKNLMMSLEAQARQNVLSTESLQKLAQQYFYFSNWKTISLLLGSQLEKLNEESLNILLTAYMKSDRLDDGTTVTKLLTSLEKPTPYSLIQISDLLAQKIRINRLKNRRTYEEENISEVILFLKESINKYPESVALKERLLFFNEEFEGYFPMENINIIEQMISQNQARPRHFSQMCLYTQNTGYIERALEACKKAVRINPKEIRNQIWYGQVLTNSGQEKRGERILASIGKKFPASSMALETSAQFFLEQKNLKKAYSLFMQATSQKNPKPSAFLGLANTAMELGKYEVALWAFRKNCRSTQILNQDFRTATGRLRSKPTLNRRFRSAMNLCKI